MEGTSFIDSHAHLGMVADKQDLACVFVDFAAAGGAFLLDVGTKPGDLPERVRIIQTALSQAFPQAGSLPFDFGYSLGAWPGEDALTQPGASLDALASTLEICRYGDPAFDLRHPVLALGEVGLDYHYQDFSPALQIEFFEGCCALAKKFSLPLIIHSREADLDTLSCLKRCGMADRSVIHCFSYGPESAKAYIDAGSSISFSGSLTFKKADELRAAAAIIPLDRVLVETDAPYLTPGKDRGKRPSTPLDAALVAQTLAQLRGMDARELGLKLLENAQRFFGTRTV